MRTQCRIAFRRKLRRREAEPSSPLSVGVDSPPRRRKPIQVRISKTPSDGAGRASYEPDTTRIAHETRPHGSAARSGGRERHGAFSATMKVRRKRDSGNSSDLRETGREGRGELIRVGYA